MLKRLPPLARRARAGFSLVEMMVGIVVGLMVVASATSLAAAHLRSSHELMQRAVLNSQLVSASRQIEEDFRNSGYYMRTGMTGNPSTTPASYGTVYDTVQVGTSTQGGSGTEMVFFHSTLGVDTMSYTLGTDDETIDAIDTRGYRLNSALGTLERTKIRGGWSSMMDTKTVEVTNFAVRIARRFVPAACGHDCPTVVAPCSTGAACTCRAGVNFYDLTYRIDARLRGDAAIKRSVENFVVSKSARLQADPSC